MAGLAVERWHHDLNVLMLEVQTGVLGPLAPPDDKRRSAVYRVCMTRAGTVGCTTSGYSKITNGVNSV